MCYLCWLHSAASLLQAIISHFEQLLKIQLRYRERVVLRTQTCNGGREGDVPALGMTNMTGVLLSSTQATVLICMCLSAPGGRLRAWRRAFGYGANLFNTSIDAHKQSCSQYNVTL